MLSLSADKISCSWITEVSGGEPQDMQQTTIMARDMNDAYNSFRTDPLASPCVFASSDDASRFKYHSQCLAARGLGLHVCTMLLNGHVTGYIHSMCHAG
jgi:hypothetical protein